MMTSRCGEDPAYVETLINPERDVPHSFNHAHFLKAVGIASEADLLQPEVVRSRSCICTRKARAVVDRMRVIRLRRMHRHDTDT